MEITNQQRADVLAQALPYIQKYYGKTVVVKYGGNAMIRETLQQAVMADIVLMHTLGIQVVLVHGGGPDINEMLQRVGKESRFVGGLRYTDEETVDIVQQVLCGRVNKNLVKKLAEHGGKAMGLSGLDGEMLIARKYTDADIGLVGELTRVNGKVILDVLAAGYIPVISTVALGENGETYNVNADTAAAKIAAKLGAEKLLLMTDIAGLLKDKEDDSTLIPLVSISEIPMMKAAGIISGGMIPKIDCCVEAVRQGVSQTSIIDGRVPHSVLMEMFTDEGCGTMFL